MSSSRVGTVRAAVVLAMSPVAALLSCDVGDLDFQLFSGADGGSGDSGWFEGECKTDQHCEAGQCCVHFLGGWCEDLVWTSSTQPICFNSGDDPDGLCACFPPQAEPMCPPAILEPPVTPECEPRPYVKCAMLCPQQVCACSTQELDLSDVGVEGPSCPPPDWSIPCPGADGGVAD